MLKREDGHVLDFEVEGRWKKGRPKKTLKNQVEKSMKVGLGREDALCRSMWSVSISMISPGLS